MLSKLLSLDFIGLFEFHKWLPKYKEVILLRYYQEMSMDEIAKALEIPVGTVATRLAAAKKKLYTKLERWYFDE